MKNNIEDFIQNNRSDFDDLVPEERVWNQIENEVSRKQDNSTGWLWKAAAIVFFCSSVFLYLNSQNITDADNTNLLSSSEDKQLNTELEQVEAFYIEMISAKRSLITSFQDGKDSEFAGGGFEEDLQKLDAMYEVLKKEFGSDPSKEVVDALVLNLLVRIDILNKKLAELDVDRPEEEKPEINT